MQICVPIYSACLFWRTPSPPLSLHQCLPGYKICKFASRASPYCLCRLCASARIRLCILFPLSSSSFRLGHCARSRTACSVDLHRFLDPPLSFAAFCFSFSWHVSLPESVKLGSCTCIITPLSPPLLTQSPPAVLHYTLCRYQPAFASCLGSQGVFS